jgi:hypothetical protein
VFHVLTVHFQSKKWIDTQLRYIRKHMPEDTQVWGCLNGLGKPQWAKFDHAMDLQGSHAEKLNEMARMVSRDADVDDYLVFLDGDAFPIANVDKSLLGGTQLAAVRRDENLGDPQPHPCFCVTTVGFWNDIRGDWRPGFRWVNAYGYSVTDVGANVLRSLRRKNLPWQPLLRSNTVNPHPVFYAVYGDVVYHHGAGFREKVTRADLFVQPARIPPWVPYLRDWELRRAFSRALKERRAPGQAGAAEVALSKEIFESIQTDEDFYRRFVA